MNTKWRCCGALPPAYAGGSAFALLTAGRCQLFDDSMNARSGEMGIFLILRGFPMLRVQLPAKYLRMRMTARMAARRRTAPMT
jgi:hypothetical protein